MKLYRDSLFLMIIVLLRRFNKQGEEVGEFLGFIYVKSFIITYPLPCGRFTAYETGKATLPQNSKILELCFCLTRYLID